MLLENLVPGELKKVRLNTLRNVIAVDAMNVLAMEALSKVATFGGMSARLYVPRRTSRTVGVISGVDIDISEEYPAK